MWYTFDDAGKLCAADCSQTSSQPDISHCTPKRAIINIASVGSVMHK
jgi:hypothetical protein